MDNTAKLWDVETGAYAMDDDTCLLGTIDRVNHKWLTVAMDDGGAHSPASYLLIIHVR